MSISLEKRKRRRGNGLVAPGESHTTANPKKL
jgi:hypothetical protein